MYPRFAAAIPPHTLAPGHADPRTSRYSPTLSHSGGTMRALRLPLRLTASQSGTAACAGGRKGPKTPCCRRTRSMRWSGTMETCVALAERYSASDGTRPARSSGGSAMASGRQTSVGPAGREVGGCGSCGGEAGERVSREAGLAPQTRSSAATRNARRACLLASRDARLAVGPAAPEAARQALGRATMHGQPQGCACLIRLSCSVRCA